MRLAMNEYGAGGMLAGSIAGKRVFADLVARTRVPTRPELCFVDFRDITVVTSSFLRDGAVAYRNHCRSSWPFLYPVAANLVSAVREEFQTWLNQTNDAMVVCDLADDETPSNVAMLGIIDGKQLVALRGVVSLGETDVATLALHVGEDVAPTAWNNRLGALVAKGLVMELSSGGRNKRYRPILEGLSYGT
jgi:hypothetical protein